MRPAYYTPSELAKTSGKPRQTINRWIREKRIEAITLDDCHYIPAAFVLPILPPDHPDRREADRQP